jgi:hypothetical protein
MDLDTIIGNSSILSMLLIPVGAYPVNCIANPLLLSDEDHMGEIYHCDYAQPFLSSKFINMCDSFVPDSDLL